MKKYLLLLLSVFAFFSCTTTQKTPVALPLNAELPQTSVYANSFRMFWADYASEVNKVKKISKFVPSDKLVKHYALQNEGKKYFVSGFLTIVPGEFNSDEAVKAGLNLKKMTGDTYTYRCELQNLPEVIGLKGVKYIEVAQKVNQRLY